MKICKNMCPKTFTTVHTKVTSCMNGIKRVFEVLTFPIRWVNNNRVKTVATVAAGVALYVNPGLLKYVAGGIGFSSWAVSLFSGSAASFMHISGKKIEFLENADVTKETCFKIAAIATCITTVSFTSVMVVDPTNPVSIGTCLVLIPWTCLAGSVPGVLLGIKSLLEKNKSCE